MGIQGVESYLMNLKIPVIPTFFFAFLVKFYITFTCKTKYFQPGIIQNDYFHALLVKVCFPFIVFLIEERVLKAFAALHAPLTTFFPFRFVQLSVV